MRAADVLVRQLSAWGVETIFALSGNQIMPLFDALLESDISIIHTRHEAAAVYMAEGYAQASGKTGVALVTAGAGLVNALGPLLCAQASQTPLLLISGDSPVAQDGQGAFQETPQTAMTSLISKAASKVVEAGQLQPELNRLLVLASSGQPGPVHLSVPVDVLNADACWQTDATQHIAEEDQEHSDRHFEMADALTAAHFPLVILGPGMRGAHKSIDFSALQAPVVLMESPRGANDPGLGSFKQAWAKTDLVIALGKPIDFSVGFGEKSLWPDARWISVQGDGKACKQAESNLEGRLLSSVHCTPQIVLNKLLDSVDDMPLRSSWLETVTGWIDERTSIASPSQSLTSAHVVSAVQHLLLRLPNTILVCDGGEFGQWAQSIKGASARIINGPSGAIGGALCQAIGARVSAPDAPVIALMGDGTVGFHISEFETAVRHKLPFVAIIGNDQRWNAEHLLQQRSYGAQRTHSCELSDARYDLAVEALGGFGACVTQVDQLEPALHEAIASHRPACINVLIEGLPAPTLDG